MRANIFLKLVGALEVDSLRLIVDFAVFEYFEDIFAEMLTVSVLTVA